MVNLNVFSDIFLYIFYKCSFVCIFRDKPKIVDLVVMHQ